MAKAKKSSAGVLLFRRVEDRFEFLVVHPGGPYWEGKDLGAWSVAKGELEPKHTTPRDVVFLVGND